MANILQTLNALDPRKQTDEVTGMRQFLYGLANMLLLVCALGALAGFAAQYGFYLSEEVQRSIANYSRLLLIGFALQALIKIAVVHKKLRFIRVRWAEYGMVTMILLHLLFPGPIESLLLWIDPRLTPVSLTGLYFGISQALFLIALIPSTLRASQGMMSKNVQPSFLLLASFLFLIAVGTLLLLLPKATVTQSMTFVDALFTATSAVCVTGLIVVDTNHYFSSLGHDVILFLIQIGGLGIMTLTTFFAFVISGSGKLKEYSTMQSLLGEESLGRIKMTLTLIALITLVIEAGGAILIYYAIGGTAIEAYHPWYFSLFHSVSAFCNAGFTLTTENLMHPALRTNMPLLMIIAALVILGGVGFPVFTNIIDGINRILLKQRTLFRLSIHTKLVLVTSAVLLLIGTVGLFQLEQGSAFSAYAPIDQWVISFFHSTIARTAGFNSVDIASLTLPSLFLIILLMWIGASPASTGGGIKTTTFAVALLNLRSIVTGRRSVEVFGKQIPAHVTTKAFSTVLLSLLYMVAALFALLITEQHPFELLLFEVVSAMSTVGLSAGITAQLTTEGKYIIVATMIVGRIGFLAFILALIPKRRQPEYEHITEEVLIT